MKLKKSTLPENWRYRFSVYHSQNSTEEERSVYHGDNLFVSPYIVVCALWDVTTKLTYMGQAVCGVGDVPNKERGREIALGRAMASAGLRNE